MTTNTEAERLIEEAEYYRVSLAKADAEGVSPPNELVARLAVRLALLLRTARVKAEREQHAIETEFSLLLLRHTRQGLELGMAERRAEAAETALADMRRERDASDAALLDCYGTLRNHAGLLASRNITIAYEQDVIDAITAARSRATRTGEEKKS